METREWDEDVISDAQFRKETDEILARAKASKTLLENMMGENYGKFFRTDEEAYTEEHFAKDEEQANYETDAKMGL